MMTVARLFGHATREPPCQLRSLRRSCLFTPLVQPWLASPVCTHQIRTSIRVYEVYPYHSTTVAACQFKYGAFRLVAAIFAGRTPARRPRYVWLFLPGGFY